MRIRRIGEQAVETPAQMRRQRHSQIHLLAAYREGEPLGEPVQTLDITTVHLKYMDVCRADAWTEIKFFQQKPDGKADKSSSPMHTICLPVNVPFAKQSKALRNAVCTVHWAWSSATSATGRSSNAARYFYSARQRMRPLPVRFPPVGDTGRGQFP